MRKILLFGLLTLALIFVVFRAETQAPFNLNYFPPSPNAAALGKFAETPVNLYTGVPRISIPVYSYKGVNDGLGLNVSLDYHACGVRVEEIASSEGLGWALNAGGVVSRTVRGLPDDLPSYGFMALSPLTTPVFNIDGSNNNLLNTFCQNGYDSEQDLFSFNFDGHSGTFLLDGSGNAILVSKEYLQIQAIPQSRTITTPFKGFIITDPTGIKYVFSDAELTNTSLSSIISVGSYTSSWYLSQIVNPFTNDTVQFNYTTAHAYYHINNSETWSNQYTSSTGISLTSNVVSDGGGKDYSVSTKKISNIILPNHISLNFFYVPTGRCDLKGDSILSEIRQTDQLTGKFKGVFLYQSYIDNLGNKTAISPAPCDLTNNTSLTTVRMRLDSVKEYGNGIVNPPYIFNYNDNYLLPATDSKTQDYWGYFNGPSNTAHTLVPSYFVNDAESSTSYFLSGADRRVDTNGTRASSLVQITYPTGGYTQFDYESNRAGDNKLIFSSPQSHMIGLNTGTFVVNRQPASLTENFNFHLGTWCPNVSQGCNLLFQITSPGEGGTVYASAAFGYSDVGTTKTVPANLPNGTYQLVTSYTTPSTCTCNDSYVFNLSWSDNLNDSSQLAGGLRIRTVTTYDGISHANDLIKRYRYVDTTGLSSGYTGSFMTFGYNHSTCFAADPQNPTQIATYQDLYRTGTTNTPMSYSQGSSVSYSRVEVVSAGPQNVGKEVDYFTGFKDFPPGTTTGTGFFTYPFVPMQVFDWKLGLLTRQELWDSSGRLVKYTQNNYRYYDDPLDTFVNFKVSMGLDQSCWNSFESSGPSLYYTNSYYHKLGRTEKAETKIVLFTPAGDSVVTDENYTYNQSYYNIASEQRVNSKGDTLTTNHYYPYDYTIGGGVGLMRSLGVIQPAVASETWLSKNSTTSLVGGSVVDYGLFGTNIFRPITYYVFNAPQPVSQSNIGNFNPAVLNRDTTTFARNITFDRYNSNGAISQYTTVSQRESLIWDINRHFPVAKIDNADSGSVAYTSFEADGWGNWAGVTSLIDTTKGLSGSHSYAPSSALSMSGLVSGNTYVVSYWTTNSSAYSITGTLSGYPVKGKAITRSGVTWTYYEHRISGISSVSITGSGNIDEVRLYPDGALMTSYTYMPLYGVTSTSSPNGFIAFYEYDGLGRLLRIRDMDGNITKQFDYQYQQATPYYTWTNDQRQGTFTVDCSTGGVGNQITYSVAAGLFSSRISKADANAQADSYISAHGQHYADSIGGCTYYNTIQVQSFTRNNCACQYTGSTVADTAAAGAFSSALSVADANQQALNYLAANGQNNANTKGTCTAATCTGTNHKWISCVCTTGTLGIISQTTVTTGGIGKCQTEYGYFFSDGTYIYDHTTTTNGPCKQ